MAEIEVKKIAYWQPVNVVDGIPQCPCCQEPMVERPGGWMCAVGAAVLDALKPAVAALDAQVLSTTPEAKS